MSSNSYIAAQLLSLGASVTFKNLFYLLFLAALGLCWQRGFSLVTAGGVAPLAAGCRLLARLASLTAEHVLLNPELGGA